MEAYKISKLGEEGKLPDEGAIASNWNETTESRTSHFAKKIHDLRSPLTSIIGLVELLNLQVGEPNFTQEELLWYLKKIEKEANRMRGMLE